MKLPKVDLNLFVVFDTVYTERNLTRAARILHITQPAVSNALKRLRVAFGDPLFVRTPRGVAPTPVADNIADRVKEALNMLSMSLAEGEKFTPRRSEKVFALAVHEGIEQIDRQIVDRIPAHVLKRVEDMALARAGHAGDDDHMGQ